MYEPKSSRLEMVKSRLSERSWEIRVARARKNAKVMEEIAGRVSRGEALNEVIRRVVQRSRRSWVIRHWRAYQSEGFEALIDARTPREPQIAKECGGEIEAARMANPRVTVDEMMRILRQRKVRMLPSRSTIKQHFARADERRRYGERKERARGEVVELRYAGGELLRAAEVETGGVAALVGEVEAMGEEALVAAKGQEPARDVELRDGAGHFTAEYNQRRKRKAGEAVASYLRSAEEKAEGRVPTWARFVHEKRETLEAKLWTMVLAPLVCSTKGWEAMRAPEMEGLAPLSGYAYMPSTLAKFSSALAISNAGPRLLERLGIHWHQMAQARWGEAGAMAALYVDNHAKEVWSSLYTQSGKVSHLNRVMPCITTTYFHTGAGTPLVASVQSGSAPLAPRLVDLVRKVEATLEGDVRRAVVIDAEGSTFDILESFAKEGRVIVTPLRPGRAPELELKYEKGSYYRPYRENDELRIATAVLTHKSTGRSLELGALLVRRQHRESDTVLLTTGLSLGMEGRDLADLYFARWPLQENAFRDGTAVGLAEHRGNCGQIVTNVAVVSELERMGRREKADREKLAQLEKESAQREAALKIVWKENQRATRALTTRQRQLDALLVQGRTEGKQLGRAAREHREAQERATIAQQVLTEAEQSNAAHSKRESELKASLEQLSKKKALLEPQRTIRKLDVAQDSVLTATKLTALLLISFVLREYLPAMRMTPHTFISRIFSISGRREVTRDEERIVFYENPRDPEVSAALADACRRLNSRHLSRDGRLLRYSIEPKNSRKY